MSTMKTLTINGETYTVTPVVPKSSVTLPANSWKGSGDSYSQVVTLSGVTLHTKVDLQPTPAQLEEFHYKTLAFVAENDGGVVTVYSIGDKPDGNHTIQVTLTEVDESGKIRGNTVGTTTPRPDWNQNDSKRADFIKNKPTELLANADAHLKNKSNPHGVTPAQIGALPTGGGAMTGNIAMGGNRITGLSDPTTNSEPLTQNFMNQSMGQLYFNKNTTFDIRMFNGRGVILVALGAGGSKGNCLWYIGYDGTTLNTEQLAGTFTPTFEVVDNDGLLYLRVGCTTNWSYGFYIATPTNRGW